MQQVENKKEGRIIGYNEGAVRKAAEASGHTLTKQVGMESKTEVTSSFMSSRTRMDGKNSESPAAAIEFRDCKGLSTT